MPIMPSGIIGFRGGDAVVPTSTGFFLSSSIVTEIGFLDADLEVVVALGGGVDVQTALSAAVRIATTTKVTTKVDIA